MMARSGLRPNIDEWPRDMRRGWTEAEILAMPRSQADALPSYEATGEPVHFFTGQRCKRCDNVAPKLVGANKCVVCKHHENRRGKTKQARVRDGVEPGTKAFTGKRRALGLGYGTLRGGGVVYQRLIPPLDSIGRSDDRAILRAKLRTRPEGWVMDHVCHIGWPLAPGCFIIGLEVAENRNPLTPAQNRRKGNRLPDPDDFSRAADRLLTIAERRWFVQHRMAIWGHDLVFDEAGRLERIRWDLYRLDAETGRVVYDGDEPALLAAAAE